MQFFELIPHLALIYFDLHHLKDGISSICCNSNLPMWIIFCGLICIPFDDQ